VFLFRDERNENDVIEKMSRNMALNLKDKKKIILQISLDVSRQGNLMIFSHFKSHLPQASNSLQPL